MDRGPVALFGAIVAVGLGPALWLGAQFGRFDVAPPRAPASVDRTHDTETQLMGGAGGGENETGTADNTPIRTKPRAHTEPMTATPSSSPTAVTPPVTDSPTTPSDDHSATPTESTDPSGGGSGNGTGGGSGSGGGSGTGGGDGSTPPSPPASGATGGNDHGGADSDSVYANNAIDNQKER